ncbi:MAG: ArsR/SmtB family transcription factor [Haloferacaceae archaeon]
MTDASEATLPRDEETIDDVLRAMADEHRRRILYHLRANGGVTDVDALVRHLSARTDLDPDSVAIRLHHVLLPRLAESGVVDYDPTRRRVRYCGGAFATELIESVGDREREN